MKSQTSTPVTRWAKRSLKQQLLYKFINEYGYEQGPVVARAIVNDILDLVDEVYVDQLPPRYLVWPAVSIPNGNNSKSPGIHELVPIRLQMVADDEVALLADRHLLASRKAHKRFKQVRFARWCREAYEQGGVLTLLDLSLLSGMSEKQIGSILRDYEKETGVTVPIRGTVHDLGRSVTHKAEVIRRYLQGQSPADIAHELCHTQRSVDAYIQDYEITRQLAQRFPVAEIPALSRLSRSVVTEHIELLQRYEPDVVLYSS